MQYIEVSKKINFSKDITVDQLKKILIERLRRSFNIGKLKENKDGFHLEGTTGGGPGNLVRYAHVSVDANIIQDGETARILLHGHSDMARSLLVSYTVLFLFLLFLGLAPGSIETGGEKSGAMDALVFLIFGIFIFYDINNKLTEPKAHLQTALDSLEVEFG